MADSSRVQIAPNVRLDKSTLDKTHAGDGSQEVYVIECTGHAVGMVTMLPDGSLTSGSYSITEGPYEGAPAAHFEEIASGSLTASTLETVRINAINGAAIKVKVTADSAVQTVAVTQ